MKGNTGGAYWLNYIYNTPNYIVENFLCQWYHVKWWGFLWGNFEKSFLEQEKMASRKVFRHFLHANFFMYIYFFPFNQELICTFEFLKKLKLHLLGRSSSRNFSFLKNSLRQINSKLNSKLYDCLYTKNSLIKWSAKWL